MSVLLVDGDNLLTIGFHGLKNYFYKGKHIGALYHFVDTLRRSFETYHLDKICVFWDGEDSSLQRRIIYPQYKDKSGKPPKSEEEINSYKYQKVRVQQYLEELYVRQVEFKNIETDDCIAYYVQNSPKEEMIIYSSDKDLMQLINDHTSIYNPSLRILYKPGDKIIFEHQEILVDNVKVVKMLCGDPSDNIDGIYGMGIKSLIKLCPEIVNTPITLNYVRDKVNLLFEESSGNKLVNNLLTGVTKRGVFGGEFFELNERLVDLTNPFITEEAKEEVQDLINENLDKEGRSYRNTMKMMMEDGIFTVLPKYDDAWVKFFNPFLRLTQIEKNKHVFKPKN